MEPDDLPRATDPALTRRVRSALDRRPADPDPEALQLRARALLNEAFGVEAEHAAFAAGYVPLSGEHTDYFAGFALLLRLPGGVSVAAAHAPGPARLVARFGDAAPVVRRIKGRYGAGDEVRDDLALPAHLLGVLMRKLGARREVDSTLVIAIHSTLPLGCPETLLAATAAAADPVMRDLWGREALGEERVRVSAEAVGEALARPFGPALLVAAQQNAPLVLVDAATYEVEALAAPDQIGWGLVDTGRTRRPDAEFYRHRLAVLENAVAELRREGFEELRSLRGLDHRDLPRALEGLDAEAKRVVRHLASEDRRVQRLLVALRKGDGQVIGAHLLMSQASLRDDWRASRAEAEFVAREAEEAEGVYGVRLVGGGFGGCMLVVGRPFLVPPFLDTLAERFAGTFGIRPGTAVL